MGIVKVLKRKDAASVVVAIVVGMVLYQLVMMVTARLAGQASGLEDGQYITYSPPGADVWKTQYLFPFVSALFQLLALEILIWVYVGVHSLVSKKK